MVANVVQLVMLPGFDGTGRLFTPLKRALPEHIQPLVLSYPNHQPLDYAALRHWLRPALPDTPYFLLAESFAGPLALDLCAEDPPGLQGLILSTSFACNPRPGLSFWLQPALKAWGFRTTPPAWLTKQLLLGGRRDATLLAAVHAALHSVAPAVLRTRLEAILQCQAGAALACCQRPLLYLAARYDRLVGTKVVQQLQEIRPDMSVRTLDGPHLLLQTAPAACAAAISAWLREQPLPGATTSS